MWSKLPINWFKPFLPQVIPSPRVSASEQANFSSCLKNIKEKIKIEIISLFGSGGGMGKEKEIKKWVRIR